MSWTGAIVGAGDVKNTESGSLNQPPGIRPHEAPAMPGELYIGDNF